MWQCSANLSSFIFVSRHLSLEKGNNVRSRGGSAWALISEGDELELSRNVNRTGFAGEQKSPQAMGAAKKVRPAVLCCIWPSWTSARSDVSPLLRGSSSPDPSPTGSFGTKALGKAHCYRSLRARREIKVMGSICLPPPEGNMRIP